MALTFDWRLWILPYDLYHVNLNQMGFCCRCILLLLLLELIECKCERVCVFVVCYLWQM